MTVYFPAWFSESDLNYLEKLKKYLLARINFELTSDPKYMAEIIKCSDYFLESNKPKNFNPYQENDIIRMEQEFESMCTALEENGITNAKDMTVYEFYSRVKYFEKKSKK